MKDGLLHGKHSKLTTNDWSRYAEYVLDKNSGKFAAPNGSIGHRWEQKGEWNLQKKDETTE